MIDYRKIADFFNALSHPIRLRMVVELLRGRRCVGDIRELVETKQPNASRHLLLLKFNGIVDWRQEGRMKCYFLRSPQLIKDILKVLEKNKLSKL